MKKDGKELLTTTIHYSTHQTWLSWVYIRLCNRFQKFVFLLAYLINSNGSNIVSVIKSLAWAPSSRLLHMSILCFTIKITLWHWGLLLSASVDRNKLVTISSMDNVYSSKQRRYLAWVSLRLYVHKASGVESSQDDSWLFLNRHINSSGRVYTKRIKSCQVKASQWLRWPNYLYIISHSDSAGKWALLFTLSS